MTNNELVPVIVAELLPCPFCGGEPSVSHYETESLWSHNKATYTQIGCDDCNIYFSTEPGYDPEAITAWNTRHRTRTASEIVDPQPEIQGDLICKVISYNQTHEDAVAMGYPSVLEALEHLSELRNRTASGEGGEGLRNEIVGAVFKGIYGDDIDPFENPEAWDHAEKIAAPVLAKFPPATPSELRGALEAMKAPIQKLLNCVRVNDEMGRVVTGQTDAIRDVAKFHDAIMAALSSTKAETTLEGSEHLQAMDAAWSEHCRLTEWCNANIPDYFSGKSTLTEKKLYDERYQAKEQAHRDFHAASVRYAMARAALKHSEGA